MLIFDLFVIGTKIYEHRRKCGLTQSEAAERAGLSERAYADIERGTANARIVSLLKICSVLGVTPDDLLTENSRCEADLNELWSELNARPIGEKKTAAAVLEALLRR